ncbi:SPX domain-containing protein [Mycena floridula]|nr:SPX domain-containing protein [Mycena floridula]
MKFSSSLKFNAVSDWWDEYIAYDELKKSIYQLEKQQHSMAPYRDAEANERSALVQSSSDAIFKPLLDVQLDKIISFYENQEKELLDELDELEEEVRLREEAGLEGDHYAEDVDDDDDDDDDSLSQGVSRSNPPKRRRRLSSTGFRGGSLSLTRPGGSTIPEELSHSRTRNYSVSSEEATDLENSGILPSKQGTMSKLANTLNFMKDSISSLTPENVWTSKSNYAYDTRLLFKRRITTLFISFSNLRSYSEVNFSGFRKILKKYDKVTYSELKEPYIHEVIEKAVPFAQQSKTRLVDASNRLVALYAKCVARDDEKLAKQQLKLLQRENIAWERDTVWRQMIGRERRGEGHGPPKAITTKGVSWFLIPTPAGSFAISSKMISMTMAIAVFAILLNVPVIQGGPENRCFAILIFCTLLWATEAIPLFVTSLMVPLLLVCFQVIRADDDDRTQLTPPKATEFIFKVMFSPTIMLLIGGFTISSALSKSNIDRIIITRVLSLAGSRPSTVLLAFMFVSCFASMWISNVAAPTLCFTLIRPILRTLPPKSAFGPALILGIALAANIGGQSSPISSPQNLIALQAMDPPLDWGSWFAVSLPVSGISILLIWGLLLASYRPGRTPDGLGTLEIKTIRPTKEPFSPKQYWVSFVCLVTIGMWCFAHQISEYVGDMGVIAIIPIIAFFATGVLKKDDFEQFAWTIVFLAMGGIALGKGVVQSGLLEVLDVKIRALVQDFTLYSVVLVLSPVVLIISTFISHTIASVLLVPIAKEVGLSLGNNHQNLLIFITGLICSAGMGMPVSGFPNQTAATQEDELGELYLTNVDFLKNGVPASIIATLVVSTIGFLLMKAIGM